MVDDRSIGRHSKSFLQDFRGYARDQRRLDDAWTDAIHTNSVVELRKFECHRFREHRDGRLARTVNAEPGNIERRVRLRFQC